MDDLVQLLMSTTLGKELATTEAETLVEACESRHVPAGTVLFETGAPGDNLFFVLAGTLDVWIGKPRAGGTQIASLGAGQIVGELEVMIRSTRVASVAVSEDAHLLVMAGAKLNHLLAENDPAANKLVLTIAHALARRLAAVNQRLVKGAPLPPSPSTESAKPTAKPPPLPTPEPTGAKQMTSDDAIVIEDNDLDMLDKLWS